MNVGVLALQGAFIEHEKTLRSLGTNPVEVRLPAHSIATVLWEEAP